MDSSDQAQGRVINAAGIALLKSFESFRAEPYLDSAGVLTCCYGHTGVDVVLGRSYTLSEAESILLDDLRQFECCVDKLVIRDTSSNEFSALVCLAFNIGCGNFAQSTVLRCLNQGFRTDAARAFLLWDKVKGVVVPGLERRRAAEKLLFETPDQLITNRPINTPSP